MSRQEVETFRKDIGELRSISNASGDRLFFICANLAWDWAILPRTSWLAWNEKTMVWAGPSEKQQKFFEHFLILVNDFDIVTSILYRLEWLQSKYSAEPNFLSADDISTFLIADVHAFQTEFRSLMDTLCHVINIGSLKSGCIPTKSFQALRKWCRDDKRSSDLLSVELAAAIAEAHWFLEMRDLRDRIIHFQSDAQVRVMSPPGEIVFGTYKGTQNERYEGPNAFQYNGWVYFRAHAGYYMGRLLHLLELVCDMAATNLDLSLRIVYWSTPRFASTYSCVDYAISALESGYPLPTALVANYADNTAFAASSLHSKISERAWHLWNNAGQPDGQEMKHWIDAEAHQLRWCD